MALFDMTSSADALEALLDRERSLILSGRIAELDRIGVEKDRLLRRMARQSGGDEILTRLQHKAERNQVLLAASARGIEAAARRLGTIQARDTSLRTYGRDGAAANLSRRSGGVDKQA